MVFDEIFDEKLINIKVSIFCKFNAKQAVKLIFSEIHSENTFINQ